MASFDDIKKVKYLISTVRKPFAVARKLSSYSANGFSNIDIEFKSGVRFESIPVGLAWMLINYYYWSNKLRSYSDEDLRALHNLGVFIYDKLKEKCHEWNKDMWGLQGTHGILYFVVRKFKPAHFIETGIAHGYSSYIILSAMNQNGIGSLTSIDNSTTFELCGQELPIGWIVPDELKAHWNVKTGRSDEILPEITDEFNVFMHDSGHTEEIMTYEYSWAAARLKGGGVLMSDDIDRNNAWSKFIVGHKEFEPIATTMTTGVSRRR